MENSGHSSLTSAPQDPSRGAYPGTGQAKTLGSVPNGPYNAGFGSAPNQPPAVNQWDPPRMQNVGNVNGYMSHGQLPPAANMDMGASGPRPRPPMVSQFQGNFPPTMSTLTPQPPVNGSKAPQNNFPPPATGVHQHPIGTFSGTQFGAPPQGSMTSGMSASPEPHSKMNQSGTTNYDHGTSRPNELPVPFHGHGQYSHQVNPLMQKTPIQTPGNSEPPSEKSSRGPSPVSGSTIDALEGQFTPGHGAPSPLFPLNRGSPLSGSPVPSTPPSGTPPRVAQPQPQLGANAAPSRLSGQPSLPGPLNQGAHTGAQQPPQFRPAPPPMTASSAPGASAPLPPPGMVAGSPQGPPARGSNPQGFPPNTVTNNPRFPPAQRFSANSNLSGFPPTNTTMPPSNPSTPGFPPTSNNYELSQKTANNPGFPPAAKPIPTMPRFPSAPSSAASGFPPSSASNVPGFPPPPTSNAPGFPPPPTSSAPGFPPPLASTVPGFHPPPTSNAPGFPPPPTSSGPGFPPHPTATSRGFPPASAATRPGFPPPSASTAPGFPPLPTATTTGFPPPPASTATGGFPPMPSSNAQRYPPPPASGYSGYPRPAAPSSSATGYPPPPGSNTSGLPPPPHAPGSFPHSGQGQMGLNPPGLPHGALPPGPASGRYPTPSYVQPTSQPMGPGVMPNSMNTMTQGMGQMGIQDSQRSINLLNERYLIGPEGIETARPTLPHDFKKINCSPDIFRCTLNAIPQTSSLLNKARLPLGILIHPFKDLSQLPVIQSSVIVRCRSCRTYINPFVVFVDQRRWKCNLCFRVNELPDEFSFDPVTKTYGDPQRRPEVKSATIEFIAPSEYMLRPPQPAVYLYLLDVSFNAVETGYLSQFCQILLDELDKLPGDARTTIGFLCYDRSLYYFNLAEGLSQPQMLVVPDLEDPFLPCPDNLLVNLHESKELVIELLNQLPSLFEGNHETGSALGAALQSAHKLMGPTGGRITVMQTCLPTVGPGALENREIGGDSGKNVSHIGPSTDFYKKLSLDCSAQQIAVDLFMLNGQYADIASLACISKYSAGCIYYYPSFHTVRNPGLVDKFETDLRRYLTRKIGFESVMRIRCTRGLSIHTFHGNFFVRSTDLLSLPNINPDAGFGMQMSIEDNLQDSSTISFQAALLYTSSKGERRIRVHTLCVPVTNQLSEIFAAADQQAIAALLAKMAVDRSLNSAISDARDAMMNASLDALGAYAQQIPASQRSSSTILAPSSLRLLPMYMLAMLKSVAFSLAGNTKLDSRVFAMQQCKTLPLCHLVQTLYPHLYPLHKLSDENPIIRGKEEIPKAPILQLSSANIERTGLFLMDTGESMYLLVGSAVGDQVCQDVFEKQNFASIPDGMMDLPELENPTSEKIRSFVNYLMDSRPNGVSFLVIRDDSKHRHLFFQHMLEDRSENSMSYYEFLQFLQGKAKG